MRLSQDESRFWRSGNWPGLELMRAHWVHHAFPKHFHDCYTIGINDAGSGRFDCRHKCEEAWPGTLNVIEPGEVHTGAASIKPGWVYRDFYISVECMRELAGQVDINGLPEFAFASVHDPQLANQFRRAFDVVSTPSAARLEQEYLLLSAIRGLCLGYGSHRQASDNANTQDRRAIGYVRDYLHAHYAEEMTTRQLAELVGWSPYRLIRAFHRAVGLPPHAYQNLLRLHEAQKRL